MDAISAIDRIAHPNPNRVTMYIQMSAWGCEFSSCSGYIGVEEDFKDPLHLQCFALHTGSPPFGRM